VHNERVGKGQRETGHGPRMKTLRIGILVLAAGLAWPCTAQGQALRGVGSGPSQSFIYDLPSYGINKTLGGQTGFTSAGRFARAASPQETSYLAARGVEISLQQGTWSRVGPGDLMPGPGLGPVGLMRVRSIESLSFEKRARFARLRETTLALAERIGKSQDASLSQVSFGFRQFMFPLPLLDQPKLGYGFFSRTDLVGGGTVSPEVFLSPFTAEVQQSLGEKAFLDLTEALLAGRPPTQGLQLDQLYDTQLAALGNYLFNNGRYPGAAQAWGVLAERDPDNATARRAVVLCLLGSRDLRRAAAEVRRSLTMTEGWPEEARITGSNLQDVFRDPRALADVRAELDAQLAKSPGDRDLGLLMAFLDLFQGRWAEAEKRLAGLAAADPVAAQLLAVLTRGAVSEAVREPVDTALRRVTEEMTGLEEAGMSPEAREQLIAALRQGAQTYEDYMRVGDFRFFMGDFTTASESYRLAHKARPEDPFALFALTHASFANGEYRQAARYLQKALAVEPNWGLFEFRLQEFYGERSEYDLHLRNLKRQVELRPQAADMKFLLAYVHYFSGRYSDAADLLGEVLRLEPGFEKANQFLKLARLQG